MLSIIVFPRKVPTNSHIVVGSPKARREEVGTKSREDEAHFLSSDLCILTY